MKFIFFAIIIALGLLMPLFWITGTLPSILYFFRHRAGETRKERTPAFGPQLGLTMADGGAPVDEEKKETAAVKPAGVSETSQGAPEEMTRRPLPTKMFWWGGYY